MEWGVDYHDKDFERELTAEKEAIFRFALYLTKDRDKAEDLSQETLLKAWVNRHQYQPGTLLRAWCFVISRNHFYSEKHRSWRQKDLGEHQDLIFESIPAPENQHQSLLAKQVTKAMEYIQGDMLEVVELVCVDGFKYEEVAELFGCPTGTIKSRVARGRRIILQVLGEQDKSEAGNE